MNRLFLISLFLMLLSACGSADNFIEELENTSPIDSIFVIPHHPNDSSNVIPADTIIAGNDTTIASKDSLSNTSKPIANDTLSINSPVRVEKDFPGKFLPQNGAWYILGDNQIYHFDFQKLVFDNITDSVINLNSKLKESGFEKILWSKVNNETVFSCV